jgi:tRNA-specific 2-thiouridylase
MARIAVAMSGGVDSAVAAALLVEQGHQVVGLTMNLWPSWLPAPDGETRACCGANAVEDARTSARLLGIRHYVLNLREEFERTVIDYFCDEYARGRTPNPCIACNQAVKFRVLLEKVEALGCDLLATGHYARIGRGPGGRPLLLRATDGRKDQSYVLFALTPDHLGRLRFPIGEYAKPEVRQIARRFGLPVADKPDSQEICFVPAGHYGDLVAARRPDAARAGPILDRSGVVVGAHNGIGRFTVGQRRGIGLAATAPRYVVDIDPQRNAVIVGGPGDLLRDHVLLDRVNWIVPPPPPDDGVTVRVRHAAADVPARLQVRDDGRVSVEFRTPQRAAAPGQAVAFYAGETVLGGGIIERETGKNTSREGMTNDE